MTAFDTAVSRAAGGIDWSYPCLIWVADYLKEATGVDFAADWRGMAFDEPLVLRELAKLAAGHVGVSAVERAMTGLAERYGWQERDGPQQGAIMVGVYTDPRDSAGFPAIFDGWRGWLVAYFGNATVLRERPNRIWEIVA